MITLICGPMLSGKTSMMLHLLERAVLAKKRAILIRPTTDTRPFLSHTQKDTSWIKEIFMTFENGIYTADYDHLQDYDVIGIDEGQFQPNLKQFCITHRNKQIIISALHATSECEMFQPIIDVVPYCENIIKLNAICTQCNSEYGSYTYYLKGNKTEKIAVGGTEDYTVLCGKCYSYETRKIQ